MQWGLGPCTNTTHWSGGQIIQRGISICQYVISAAVYVGIIILNLR
jgi:hypothetical protein